MADEGDHTFTLNARSTGPGTAAPGMATINDQGQGVIFADAPPVIGDGGELVPAIDTTSPKDYDRPNLPPQETVGEMQWGAGPYDRWDTSDRREWEIIPLGPPPALVTGIEIATGQGTSDGFSFVNLPPSSVGRSPLAFGSIFDRPTLASTFSTDFTQYSTPLLHLGWPPEGQGDLFVAKEPGQKLVLNEERSVLLLPRGMLGHADRNADVSISYRLADGSDLPEWVIVNIEAGKVIVVPPKDFVGVLTIVFTARDEQGGEASTELVIEIRDKEEQAFDLPDLPEMPKRVAMDGVVATPLAERSTDIVTKPNAVASDEAPTGLSHMLALSALERSAMKLSLDLRDSA